MNLMTDLGSQDDCAITFRWTDRNGVAHETQVSVILTPRDNATELRVSVNNRLTAIHAGRSGVFVKCDMEKE